MKNKKTPEENLIDHLKKHGKDRSWTELTQMFNPSKSTDWSRKMADYHLGKDFKNAGAGHIKEYSVDQLLDRNRQSALNKAMVGRVKILTEELERTKTALDNAITLKKPINYSAQKIEWNSKTVNEGVALIQLSDYHVGKKIERRTMNGLNEYNPDIARLRSQTISRNVLKLVRKERQDIKIDNLVINFGGDFINNFLHEGDQHQNYFTPLDEAFFAKELLGDSLKTIAENGDFKKIVLLCNRGNHPRTTKKMQSDVDYKTNLEYLLYRMLAWDFKDAMFEWHTPESDIGYYNIGDFVIRYFHGHQIGYQGGVGGLTIPMNKKIMYWDKTKKAHWNLCSHWHTYMMATNRCSVNGSLCGYDAYAQTCGFEYEPPMQSLQLLDRKRGFTGRFPIFAE